MGARVTEWRGNPWRGEWQERKQPRKVKGEQRETEPDDGWTGDKGSFFLHLVVPKGLSFRLITYSPLLAVPFGHV